MDEDACRLVEVFQEFDTNGDGYFSKPELANVMRKIDPGQWPDKRVNSLWTTCDTDKSGYVDYEEFIGWLFGSEGWINAKRNVLRSEDTFKSSDYVRFNPGRVNEHYDSVKKLGEGAFGKVLLVKHKETEALRALKCISLEHTDTNALNSEIQILKALDNPNIMKLYEFFKDQRMAYLVMELCSGGSLVDRITSEQTFSEKQAAHVMEQAVEALRYMHARSVCHRDLKTDNLLLKDRSPLVSCTVQIGDFGLAIHFVKGRPMTDVCGTPFYMSPEVTRGRYSEKCDTWAMGVIMYVLLCGYPPFNGRNVQQLFQVIQRMRVDMPRHEWKNISLDAKHLIKAILVAQARRLTADQIMNHRWIKEKAPEGSHEPLHEGMYSSMKNFCGTNKMKKVALHILAQRLKDEEIQALKDTFVTMDVNKDGIVKIDELRRGLSELGENGAQTEKELRTLLQNMDTDGDAQIEYTEFLAAALEKQKFGQEQACWTAFSVFDVNGNGSINRAELRNVLNHEEVRNAMGTAVERVMTEVDKNNDGLITFEEFMAMMNASDPVR